MWLDVYKTIQYPKLIEDSTISNEGISNTLFKIISPKQILTYTDKLIKYIKSNKIYFNTQLKKKQYNQANILKEVLSLDNRIHEVIKFYTINGGDLTQMDKFYLSILNLFPNLAKKKHVDRILYAGCLVNIKGELFDYKSLCDDIISNGYDQVFNSDAKYLDVNNVAYYLCDYILKYNGYSNGCHPDTVKLIESKIMISNTFFNTDDIKSMVEFVDDFFITQYNKIHKQLSALESELNRYKKEDIDEDKYSDLYNELNKIYAYVKLLSYPAKLVFDYIRFIEYFTKTYSSIEHITTYTKPEGRLYHISTNPNLGVIPDTEYKKRSLSPRPPETGLTQLLPARVCFAPDPLLCCYGTPYTFIAEYNPDLGLHAREEGEFVYYTTYLYEGVHEQGKTRYIKPEYIIAEVGESMFSKEIAVVSPIKIKLVGKIEIKYRYHLDIADTRKFVSYRLVE